MSRCHHHYFRYGTGEWTGRNRNARAKGQGNVQRPTLNFEAFASRRPMKRQRDGGSRSPGMQLRPTRPPLQLVLGQIGAGEDGDDFVATLLDIFAAALLSVDQDEDESDVAAG